MTLTGPPPRPDVDDGPTPWRTAAIVLLIVALIAQVVFFVVGLLALTFEGASGLEFVVFLIVGAGAGWGLLWLLTAMTRDRVRPTMALFALALPLMDGLIVLFLASGTLGGSCSDRELAIVDAIAQFPGTAATFDYEAASGSCAASFEVDASPGVVISHYRGELEDSGWTVVVTDIPAESEGEPVMAEELAAHRGGDSFTIALESSSGRTSAAIRVDAD